MTAVEFVQTDAAVNSGNSGSPVFVNGIPVTENDGSYDAIPNNIGALKPGDTLGVRVFRQGLFVKLSTPLEP